MGLTFQGETEIDSHTSKLAPKAGGGRPRAPGERRREAGHMVREGLQRNWNRS